MFIDEAEIYVRSGKGGDGCLSFRRAKFEPYGGPDGGIGGDGGAVILRAATDVETLLDFNGRHHWKAENGGPGAGAECAGRKGEDLVIELPVGTLVYDRDTGVLLKDLSEPGMTCCVARGGKGGRGNRSFATAVQQAPREFEPGEPSEERYLKLELKLIADIGLVGLPNAGKSTLLSTISRARPKIGAYPFTTLRPQLGIAELPGERRLVIADIPGLIKGAHEGAGLGDAFLRHIERTRLIVHLIDLHPLHGQSPAEAYFTIRAELNEYSAKLAATPEVVVANKLDLAESSDDVAELSRQIGVRVLGISAATRRGVGELTEHLWTQLHGHTPQRRERVDLPVPPHLRQEE